MPSVLPPNATRLEKDLERLFIDYLTELPLIDLSAPLDPWRCPVDLLPWTAEALGVDEWRSDWLETTKRRVLAEALRVRQLHGTPAAVNLAVAPFFESTVLTEWHETGNVSGTFHIAGELPQDRPTDRAQLAQMERVIQTTKRASQHHSFNLHAVSFGAACYALGLYESSAVAVAPYRAPGILAQGNVSVGCVVHGINITTLRPAA